MDIKNDVKLLGNNIKRLRIERNISQSQLANLAGINIGTLLQLEKGIGNPLIGTLYKLSVALKIKLYVLCKGI